jgi:diguanylate cyclase (GGDEF)-like protein
LGTVALMLVGFSLFESFRRVDTLAMGTPTMLASALFVGLVTAGLAAFPGAMPTREESLTRLGAGVLVASCSILWGLSLCHEDSPVYVLMSVLGVGFAMLVPLPSRQALPVIMIAMGLGPATWAAIHPQVITELSFAQDVLDIVAGGCIAAMAALAHEWLWEGRAQTLDRLANSADYDGLTGVLNRRSVLDRMLTEAHRVDRYGGRYSVVLFDVDSFKQYNLKHGYEVGDTVLKEVSLALQEVARAPQWQRHGCAVGRYGGEEFLAVVPDVTLGAATLFVEECTRRVRESSGGEYGQGVTVSAGLFAVEQGDGVSAGSAIAAADTAMYRAKKMGGDHVEVATADDAPSNATHPHVFSREAAGKTAAARRVPTRSATDYSQLNSLVLIGLLFSGAVWTLLFGLLDLAYSLDGLREYSLYPYIVVRVAAAIGMLALGGWLLKEEQTTNPHGIVRAGVALGCAAGIISGMRFTGGITSTYFPSLIWVLLAWSVAFTVNARAVLVVTATVAASLAFTIDISEEINWTPVLQRISLVLASGFMAANVGLRFERLRREESAARALLDRMAHLDPLTNLPNRVAMMERLRAEIQRARPDRPVGLILLDLDHFKSVNDRFGHLAGDEALARVADALEDTIRGADIAARLGGEELVVLAPNTQGDGLLLLAERLRAAVARCKMSNDEITLTSSLGVATWVDGDTAETLLYRADHALAQAKRDGRNRVALAPELLQATEHRD